MAEWSRAGYRGHEPLDDELPIETTSLLPAALELISREIGGGLLSELQLDAVDVSTLASLDPAQLELAHTPRLRLLPKT